MTAFQREALDELKSEFDGEWKGKAEYEDLIRDLHLGIAYHDAGQPMKDIDSRAVALIEKHAPKD